MRFVEHKGSHYIMAGELKVLIHYNTRSSPEAFGAELPGIFKALLDDETRVFDIYYTGDMKYLVHTNYEPQGFTASLSELRRDGVGMDLPAPIPRIAEPTGLPLVAVKAFGEDTGFHFHEFDQPFRSVSQIILDSMRQVINADGESAQ